MWKDISLLEVQFIGTLTSTKLYICPIIAGLRQPVGYAEWRAKQMSK